MIIHTARSVRCLAVVVALAPIAIVHVVAQTAPAAEQTYENADSRALVRLVTDASALLRTKGEAAFDDFRVTGSRWRQGESYIFVLDREGNMLVHSDAGMEGKNQLALKDVNGKPIIRGLIDAATMAPDKPAGWFHYEWPVPGGLLPRWKSSYVRLVTAPSGNSYVVGSGIYNDRMERAFVVDAVKNAVAAIEANGAAAFPMFHDRSGPFMAKNAYVFVIDRRGVELVNPAFPNLEGRNLLDVKDTEGKPLVRAMLETADASGSGWVDYLWPKPGESVSTLKSTYVSRAMLGEEPVVVGCGVYLADAPRVRTTTVMSAPELMALVRDGATLLEKTGEHAYPIFREHGSKWFRDGTYLFAWTMEGVRVFHAADPSGEGEDVSGMKDVIGRPIGRMILDVARSPSGQGWVHYMYPEPGRLFPIWKSTFVTRVTYPSGRQYVVGSGVYNMQIDRTFIQDVVDRAAALVAAQGRDAFPALRDKTGPFVFMDTYIFVESPDGTELANGGHPGIEGKNLSGMRDVKGKLLVDDYIAAAMKHGSTWEEYYWYRPGENTPARKLAYVRKVQYEGETFIVGSGLYTD